MYIETIQLQSWKDYVDLHENKDLTSYIFRGQSNSIAPSGDFIKWGIESSFNRFYTKKFSLQFSNVLNQHLQDDLFKSYYGNYSYRNIFDLTSLSALQKCYYLQHYGLPTCLIDFTSDPLIALYFAMSGIQGTSGSSYDGDGNCTHFSNAPDRDYVSIYRLDCDVLKDYIGVKELNSENFDSWLSSYKTYYHRSNLVNVKLGLILHPQEDPVNDKNYNLATQKGCFLLFDNEEGLDIDNRPYKVDFIRFLQSHEKHVGLSLPKPALTIFNIGYNSFMNTKDRFTDGKANISAFTFLKEINLTGKNLFDDIQGLKYDFNFFHSR